VFTEVLTVVQDGDIKIGAPFLEGAKVTVKVVNRGKRRKSLFYKYKSKANFVVSKAIGNRIPRFRSKKSKHNHDQGQG